MAEKEYIEREAALKANCKQCWLNWLKQEAEEVET